jgi:hypothetical protein
MSQDTTSSYQQSPMTRQPLVGGGGGGGSGSGAAARGMGSFALGGKTPRRAGGTVNTGPLGR